MRFSNSNVLPTSFDCNGCVIGQRTQSDRTADGIRSGGERKPIGWRTQSDWVAGAFKGVHLRYFNIARLVHFLLWQAAKPSGDKCTP